MKFYHEILIFLATISSAKNKSTTAGLGQAEGPVSSSPGHRVWSRVRTEELKLRSMQDVCVTALLGVTSSIPKDAAQKPSYQVGSLFTFSLCLFSTKPNSHCNNKSLVQAARDLIQTGRLEGMWTPPKDFKHREPLIPSSR